MTPTILKITKEDAPIIGVESCLSISFSLPKVCKPTVTSTKIEPALGKNVNGYGILLREKYI